MAYLEPISQEWLIAKRREFMLGRNLVGVNSSPAPVLLNTWKNWVLRFCVVTM